MSLVAGQSASEQAHGGSSAARSLGETAVASGPGSPAQVDTYDGVTSALLDEFFAFDPAFQGIAFVAGS